ncbi:flagellar motor protein MotB [Vogesella sp. LIG4]|uniref:flagellar motor protein MotB n=1 Tax=Vogesella sp. LIG4 TaxID=1192162 RepID=UPI00081FFAC3|nr:flagellar motor protein MotB [Vogesella sp. LIG4]SCK25036.1 chemotaxis protein MotB [Vogesella sp. LIG4]
MADESQRPIVVKKIKKGGHGHHGGAWKIAYADFVTAMMAFFLLMWLLGSTSTGILQGISDYFRSPLKTALQGGEGTGAATSVIKGGGTDLTKSTGVVSKGSPRQQTDQQKGRGAQDKERMKLLQQRIQQRLDATLNKNDALKSLQNQIRMEMTPDGLRIMIIDEQNRPMFQSGGFVPLDHTRLILQQIGRELNGMDNHISISGHTDANRFPGSAAGYTNWELSADRANAARREMVAGGMLDEKVLRVVGLGAADPINKQNVFSPENRRIAIVILTKEAEDRIRSDGGQSGDASAPAGDVAAASQGKQ